METLKSKALVYDGNCPMCSFYTQQFVKSGVLDKNERVSFAEAGEDILSRFDFKRARHEIPLLDFKTGKVTYGLESLFQPGQAGFPLLSPLLSKTRGIKFFQPLYSFTSYNRRVIAGSGNEAAGELSCAPDFNLRFRLILIFAGVSYTGLCIYLFAGLMHIAYIPLFAAVVFYFLILILADLVTNKSFETRLDYVGHLATLGFIEGTIFILTALLARTTGLTGLMFAGQGAARFLAIALHASRVKNNGYSRILNYAFSAGAVALVVWIAFLKGV